MKNDVCFILAIFICVFILANDIDVNRKKSDARFEQLENKVEQNKAEVIERLKQLVVTSYSPSKRQCDNDPEITASMLPVAEGTIAVSRDLFKSGWVFGRHVYVEGLGIFEIRDLMNKRFKKRIDIFRWNRKHALKFGKKKLAVALLNI